MRNIYIITLIALCTVALVAFQNCAKPVSFSSPTSKVGGDGNPDVTTPTVPTNPTPPAVPETPGDQGDTDIIKDCKTQSLAVKEQTVKFASNRDANSPSTTLKNNVGGRCNWGKNDNEKYISNVNDTFTARLEETKSIDLPVGAKICDMEFDFKENPYFKYDDHMFISLNDRILMSTAKGIVNGVNEQQSIGTVNGVFQFDGSGYVYNWLKLKNKKYDFGKTDIYCNGSQSTCAMPKTTSGGGLDGGNMMLNISKSVIQSIRLMTESSYSGYTLKVITGGDNDNANHGDGQDCSHEDIELVVKTKYYVP